MAKTTANPRDEGEEHYSTEEKEDIRRGGLQRTSIGEKSEFRGAQGVSLWLSCWGSRFLTGNTTTIFSSN